MGKSAHCAARSAMAVQADLRPHRGLAITSAIVNKGLRRQALRQLRFGVFELRRQMVSQLLKQLGV